MKLLASKSRIWLSLLLVLMAGIVAFALAPAEGAGATYFLALTAALFILEVVLGIADHLRSEKTLGRDSR